MNLEQKVKSVISALFLGLDVELIEGYRFVLYDIKDGTKGLGVKAKRSIDGNNFEDAILGQELSIDSFISCCKSLSDEYITELIANKVLSNKKTNEKRNKI